MHRWSFIYYLSAFIWDVCAGGHILVYSSLCFWHNLLHNFYQSTTSRFSENKYVRKKAWYTHTHTNTSVASSSRNGKALIWLSAWNVGASGERKSAAQWASELNMSNCIHGGVNVMQLTNGEKLLKFARPVKEIASLHIRSDNLQWDVCLRFTEGQKSSRPFSIWHSAFL